MHPTNADASVTVVVTRTVRPGCESRYQAWLSGVGAAASRFEGHQGLTVLRPTPGGRDYTLIFRFDSVAHLQAWEAAPIRAQWVASAEALCESTHRLEASGVEAWFTLPGSAAVAPPKWKMALVSWGVAYPTIQLLQATLGRLLSELEVPALVRGACVGLCMVVFMTYAAMPRVTRWLSPWLFGQTSRREPRASAE